MSESLTPENLNILWLTENYFPNRGGMAQSCDRITHSLRNLNVNIHIVHFTNPKLKLRKQKVKNGSYIAFPVSNDPSHTFNLLWNYLKNPKNQQKYTHLVAFGGNLPILSAPILARWLSVPLVTMLRGNDFDSAIFSQKKRDNLFFAFQNSAVICSVSSDKLEKITPFFPDIPKQFIPNGINLNDWQIFESEKKNAKKWRKKNLPENKKLIGIFGHLKPKKGLDFWIEAVNQSTHKNDIHLLLTGEFNDEIKNQLDETNISYSILPFLDRFELLSYYPACDAVAIPSHYDGMPNVLLEAGSLKVPIIASQTGGINDVIKHKENGFLFYPGDIQDAANAIIVFFNTPHNELKQLAKRLQQTIKTEYSHQKEAENYLNLFVRKLS